MIPALQVLFTGPKCHDTCTAGTMYLLSLHDNYQWLHLVCRLNAFFKDLRFQLKKTAYQYDVLFSYYDILKMAKHQKKSYKNIDEIIDYVMNDENDDTV